MRSQEERRQLAKMAPQPFEMMRNALTTAKPSTLLRRRHDRGHFGLLDSAKLGEQRRERRTRSLHCEVTVVVGFLSDSGFAPCSRPTAAKSCVSLSLSGGT